MGCRGGRAQPWRKCHRPTRRLLVVLKLALPGRSIHVRVGAYFMQTSAIHVQVRRLLYVHVHMYVHVYHVPGSL